MTVRDPDNSDIIGALQLLLSKKIWFIIASGNFPLQKQRNLCLRTNEKTITRGTFGNLGSVWCYIIKEICASFSRSINLHFTEARKYFSRKFLSRAALNKITSFLNLKSFYHSRSFSCETPNGLYRRHKRNCIIDIIRINTVTNPSCISNFYRDYVHNRATITNSHICITSAIPDVSADLSSIDGKVKLLNRSFAGRDCDPPDGRGGKLIGFVTEQVFSKGSLRKVIEGYRGEILIARLRGLCLTCGPRRVVGDNNLETECCKFQVKVQLGRNLHPRNTFPQPLQPFIAASFIFSLRTVVEKKSAKRERIQMWI